MTNDEYTFCASDSEEEPSCLVRKEENPLVDDHPHSLFSRFLSQSDDAFFSLIIRKLVKRICCNKYCISISVCLLIVGCFCLALLLTGLLFVLTILISDLKK